jgi:hypothetical protein
MIGCLEDLAMATWIALGPPLGEARRPTKG